MWNNKFDTDFFTVLFVLYLGRILNGDPDYHDSWHDVNGYVKFVADLMWCKLNMCCREG